MSTHTSWDTWLSSLSTESLATLLSLRPDVAVPPPTSLVVLSTRLTQQRSYRRALGNLNRPQLYTLNVLTCSTTELSVTSLKKGSLLSFLSTTEIEEILSTLVNYALLYPTSNDAYLPAPGLAEVLPHLPLDLADNPPLRDCAALRTDIARLPDNQRHVLETLAESGRRGTTTALREAGPDHPLYQLLSKDLLRRDGTSEDTVLLPEDIYCALHHSVASAVSNPLNCPQPQSVNTVLTRTAHNTAEEPATGIDNYAFFLHTVRELIDTIDTQPLHALADGGIGQRELRRLTNTTNLPTAQIVVGVEALAALSIIEEDLAEEGNWITTANADTFLASTPAEQWELLLRTWWYSSRPWSGTPHERAIVLNPEAGDGHLRLLRHQILENLAIWPADILTASEADVAALTHWCEPLIPALAGGAAFEDTIHTAEILGILHSCTLTQVGRALLTGDVSTAIGSAIPAETTSILIQDDHTIVVPGFLSPQHTDIMRRIATVESPGMATVYRISEESIRHALDTGLTATDIHNFLHDLSHIEVPQSLSYLIDDAARRHGALRVAPALSVVHSDDPALIRSVLASPALQNCGLRLIAPTVAIADVTPRELHSALQDTGLSPILEDSHGCVLSLRQHRPRPTLDNCYASLVPADTPLTSLAQESQLSPTHAEEIASQLHAATENSRHSGPVMTGDTIIPLLHDAINKHQEVILGFIKGTGVKAQIRLLPRRMSEGMLDAVEVATHQPYRFALHKIRSASIISNDS